MSRYNRDIEHHVIKEHGNDLIGIMEVEDMAPPDEELLVGA